ncbi:MAG: aspartate kinase [Chlamydiae bacterium]|nr:MAG: aspartate kinase [Chlamydiota bacterium]
MNTKVCKFGGTSLANAEQFKKVRAIIEADPSRRVIVLSAPGKRNDNDQKITDLLLVCQELADQGLEIEPVFNRIRERFIEIVEELKISIDIIELLNETERLIIDTPIKAFVASRGEYLSAKVFAAWIDAEFIEPAETIVFRNEEHICPSTYPKLSKRIGETGLYVVPGFYGADENGLIKIFPRGGSDITGAITARAVEADVYENWTDVSGFLMADPRIVNNPESIKELTYKELRELSYMGATVLHDEAIFPVRDVGIPIEIKNTNKPSARGTRIVSSREPSERIVTGIAGLKNFVMFQIEKTLMNKMVGFGRNVLQIFESRNISYDHTPTGIDTMSVVVRADNLGDKLDLVIDDINRTIEPDRIDIVSNLAIIATVGVGMVHHVGTAGKLFTALADEGINIRIIDQGSSEINIIVGVNNKDYEKTINAIYRTFVK